MSKHKLKKIKQGKKEKLFLDEKLRISADTIFEYKLFKNGKRLVAICSNEKNEIFVVFAHTDKNEMTTIVLNPKPVYGIVIHLLGKCEDKEMRVGYYGADNKHYVLFSYSQKTRGPFTKEAYDILLCECGIL